MAAPIVSSVRCSFRQTLRISAKLLGGSSSRCGTRETCCGCQLLQHVCFYNTNPTNNWQDSAVYPDRMGLKPPDPAGFDRGVSLSKEEQTWRALATPDQPGNAKLLRLAIIGRPNCGKSTLTNQLLGLRVSSVSNKVHTTRKRTVGVWTHGETQLVFVDTPGIIDPLKRRKHHLEKSLVTDPHQCLEEADLVAVVVDVSQPWNRTELDQEILKALHMNAGVPSILVLNKVDKLADKKVLLTTVRRLTEGIVAGKEIVKGKTKMLSKTDLLSRSDKRTLTSDPDRTCANRLADSLNDRTQDVCTAETISQSDPENVSHLHGQSDDSAEHHEYSGSVELQSDSFKDYTEDQSGEVLLSDSQSDESWIDVHQKLREVKKLIKNKYGWPHFHNVFMISALTGDGVQELKDYVLECAKPADWLYHSSLVTDQDPMEIARTCVWEKLLDHLREEIPYNLDLEVTLWELDTSGRLMIAVEVTCSKKRYIRAALGPGGKTIRDVSVAAEAELAQIFQRDVTLKVMVRMNSE